VLLGRLTGHRGEKTFVHGHLVSPGDVLEFIDNNYPNTFTFPFVDGHFALSRVLKFVDFYLSFGLPQPLLVQTDDVYQ